MDQSRANREKTNLTRPIAFAFAGMVLFSHARGDKLREGRATIN
jgi:hypothetical protein